MELSEHSIPQKLIVDHYVLITVHGHLGVFPFSDTGPGRHGLALLPVH